MAEQCRVCMCKSTSNTLLSEILKNSNEMKVTYVEAFNDCTQLGAEVQDALPQSICSRCCFQLEQFYEFARTAKETDDELRIELRNQNLSEHQNEEQQEVLVDNDGLHTSEIMISADPLENSIDEFEHKDQLYSFDDDVQVAASSDDEDDKPLKELLDTAPRKSKRDFGIEESGTNCISSILGFDANFDEMLPFAREYPKSDSGDSVPDFTLTAEVQLFPKGRYKCENCGSAYFTLIGLKTHLEMHFPKKDTVQRKRLRGPNKLAANAKIEPLQSPTEIITEKKLQTPKPPKPKKVFPCQICGKHMISASKLRYHLVMHTGQKDYLCTICPKAYSTIYALKHHMNTHTGHRPYECKFCGDKFTRPTTLKSHMRRHTGERPYGCDICGKRFIQHSSMTTHMKLNHMDKTIPCPHCDKKYARQTDLNTHLLSHTGNKPFSCQLCPSRFIRQANLNKHTNQHHGNRSINDTFKAMKLAKRCNNTTKSTDVGLKKLLSNVASQVIETTPGVSVADPISIAAFGASSLTYTSYDGGVQCYSEKNLTS